MTGLHLHGLNKNTRAFSTAPPSEVNAFAREFGFIETAVLTMSTVAEVRKFTDEIAETGIWRGEPVEGFVVRSKVAWLSESKPKPVAYTTKGSRYDADSEHASPPPYPPGSDFFFKIKFDEPYLMYRAWREITKIILSHRALSPARQKEKPLSIPKARLNRSENKVYQKWVMKEIERAPKDFESFQNGHGIIEIRERFLKYLEAKEGRTEVENAGGATNIGSANAEARVGAVGVEVDGGRSDDEDIVPKEGKVVIVPIAVPGCGMCIFMAFLHPSSLGLIP